MENDTESLLFRYIKGTVSEEEAAEAERLSEESAEARKMVEQLCVIDHGSETLRCMREANPQKSLRMVKRKIRQNKMHRIIIRTQRAAVVLFIPLLCLTVYFSQRQSETIREQPQLVEIASAPGLVTAVILPDSTKVWLNADSRIKYPTFFAGDTREVSISGEAYFSVAENKEKPFFVNMNDAFKIKVTGTEFNAEADPSSSVYSTTLVEGSVQLVSAADPAKPLLTLRPGEQSLWDIHANTVKVQEANIAMVTAWKDGKIIFKNTPIAEIAATLEKRYNARFIISPRLNDYSFTGTFTNQQLIQILEHFRISSGIKYEIKGLDLNPDGTINSTIVVLK